MPGATKRPYTSPTWRVQISVAYTATAGAYRCEQDHAHADKEDRSIEPWSPDARALRDDPPLFLLEVGKGKSDALPTAREIDNGR